MQSKAPASGAAQASPRYAYLPCPLHDDTAGGGIVGSPPEDSGERFGPGPRRSSGGPHLIKWGGGAPPGAQQHQQQAAQSLQRRKLAAAQRDAAEQPLTPTSAAASRQVSFSGNRTSGSSYTPLLVQGSSPARSEPISLATLDRDCFIIPLASLERFLPAGVPSVPSADKKRPGSPLSVLEVEDPKQCILAHFMTTLEPLDPLLESPVSRPLVLQRDTAAELLSEIAPSASQSILLANMECNGGPVRGPEEVRAARAALRCQPQPRPLQRGRDDRQAAAGAPRRPAAHTLHRLHRLDIQGLRGRRRPQVRAELALLDRGPNDVQVPPKVRRPAPDNAAQIHVSGRQDLPAHLRVLAAPGESLRGRDPPAGAPGPTLRLHRPLQALGLLLTLLCSANLHLRALRDVSSPVATTRTRARTRTRTHTHTRARARANSPLVH
ncbi:uncharacterized protein LOC100123617 isoform X6 [Nasonia vitripennis]|uniref:Uncharacterized protein n=1 Tax=Nasonia vitripennis TaxID=7425 RepID=A0A7M7QYY9_NASVI|nr:uncharacterized protein LOC100123617 isoform X6 [Nasonia vitripennis]